MTFLMSVADEH